MKEKENSMNREKRRSGRLILACCLLSLAALALHGQVAASGLKADADSVRRAEQEKAQEDAFVAFFSNSPGEPVAKVTLVPNRAVEDTVECELMVYIPQEGNEERRVQVVIRCNREPDDVPPVVIADGGQLRKSSQSSSLRLMNGVETHEYQYRYHFYPSRSGSFTCCTKGLTFGGTLYDGDLQFDAEASPVASAFARAGSDMPSPKNPRRNRLQGEDLAMLLLIYGASWLLLKIRYRRESESEMAEFVLRTHRLNLNVSYAFTHYGIALGLFYVAAVIVLLCLRDNLSGNPSPRGISPQLCWIVLGMVVAGILSWRRQTRKLYFRPVKTSLDKEAIFQALAPVGDQHGWILDHAGEDCIVAHTRPSSIWSTTWGEQIFVVFGDGCVWINSVNDLNKRTVLSSFGHTRRNMRLVEEAIRGKEADERL